MSLFIPFLQRVPLQDAFKSTSNLLHRAKQGLRQDGSGITNRQNIHRVLHIWTMVTMGDCSKNRLLS